ncbi:MAG: TRAP transporter small permease subunit [Microvirga sp.]|jgi:TRAP-type mannitol/chloroaromatic compound transport system permease small subunit
MPQLNFVLPHWMYWGVLLLFPFIAMYLVARQKRLGEPTGPSLFVAYLFWICAGFSGLHRFYLRNAWGFVFIPVFLGILYVNDDIRDRLEDVSRTRAAYESAHLQANRIRPNPGVTLSPEATQRVATAQARETDAKGAFDAAAGQLAQRRSIARWLAILMAAMLLIDAVLLPGLVRRREVYEAAHPRVGPAAPVPDIPPAGTHEDPTVGLHTRATDVIEWVNVKIGVFAAYWALISVFAYFYEVIARFVFNSPTNWVHESMFLMYGMQYMLAGAYAYREDQHVRVDVFYAQFTPRWKAIADIITSLFFFIFIGTMFWTGWRFASDAINNNEVSFTEWGVQYWPVKLAIPIGAGLLLLQGLAKLIKDIVLVTGRKV